MCGIAGLYSIRNNSDELLVTAGNMAACMQHRGPDDQGIWGDAEAGLALSQRRLSILDLSPEGHQPMHSASGRFVIVFNGEIYNYRPLKTELSNRGHQFRGGSDTEIILAGFEEWGIAPSLAKFAGMFAIAVWDRKERILTVTRDRIGEKPLYYGWANEGFIFASELKALKQCASFKPQIDREALHLYMRYGYVPAPYSIYCDVFKLLPGSYLSLPYAMLGRRPADFSPVPEGPPASKRPVRYWSAADVITRTAAHRFPGDEPAAIDQLSRILSEVIREQMIADVPLGAFLSGGIDSSLVVALMQQQSTLPVRTFSIGFHEDRFNEAHHAKKVANHLGTAHTELYITPAEAQAVVPLIPGMFDEPFSDSSQIPTYLVSKLARDHVTVSLSGDGGDELFCGYQRYPWADDFRRWAAPIPVPLRQAMAWGIRQLPQHWWEGGMKVFSKALADRFNVPNFGWKMHRLAELLESPSTLELYKRLMSQWDPPSKIVMGAAEPISLLSAPGDSLPDQLSYVEQLMYLDLMSYLPDDIMVKVDRSSMAVSLESRAPFLDYRVVEYALSLPSLMKYRQGKTKWILRQLLYRHVPKDLVERPKMGFTVPIEEWLRGPLKDWAAAGLDRKQIESDGLLDPEPIWRIWHDHQLGRRNWSTHLWTVLMFQAWLAHVK